MKTALGMLVAFFLAMSSVQAATRSEAVNAVFRINGTCSATAIDIEPDKTMLLTALHCIHGKLGVVEYEYRVNGELITYTQFVYKVVREGIGVDLALVELKANVLDIKPVKIADELRVGEGDEVWAIGYPLGATRTITRGTFNGLQNLNEENPAVYYRASAAVAPGSSGGALFQEAEGGGLELIGVTSRGYLGFEFMNLFVTLDQIRVFLRLEGPRKPPKIPPIKYYDTGGVAISSAE